MDDQCRLSPDLEDLSRLFFGVRGGDDDEQAIQKINRDAMRALIVCATDTKWEEIQRCVKKVVKSANSKLFFFSLFWKMISPTWILYLTT